MEVVPKMSSPKESEINKYDESIHDRRTKSAPHSTHETIPRVSNNVHHLDISQQNIKEVPQYIFETFKHIQYLYLEGNLLEEIPQMFFPSLTCLMWLDVRKNLLTTLPTNIAHHANLEVLLLQENKIKCLPLELGLVPKLRGVQLLGNPIEFPPADILSKGVQSMLQFLQEEWNIHSPATIRPIEEPFYKKPAPKGITTRSARKMKSKSGVVRNTSWKTCRSAVPVRENDLPLLSVVSCHPNVNPIPPSPVTPNEIQNPPELPYTQNIEYPGLKRDSKSAQYVMDIENKTVITVSKRNSLDSSKRTAAETKIYENLLKEMWMSRIKKMLEKQAEIIQKRKNEDILQAWRKDYRRLNEMANFENMKKHEFSVPYDVDADYMTMLSRFDLRNSSKWKGMSALSDKKSTKTVAEEMSDVFASLQKLQDKRSNTKLSPHTEQQILNAEIQTLANLQKRLQALKFRNLKDDAVFTPENLNPIIVKGVKSTPTDEESK